MAQERRHKPRQKVSFQTQRRASRPKCVSGVSELLAEELARYCGLSSSRLMSAVVIASRLDGMGYTKQTH